MDIIYIIVRPTFNHFFLFLFSLLVHAQDLPSRRIRVQSSSFFRSESSPHLLYILCVDDKIAATNAFIQFVSTTYCNFNSNTDHSFFFFLFRFLFLLGSLKFYNKLIIFFKSHLMPIGFYNGSTRLIVFKPNHTWLCFFLFLISLLKFLHIFSAYQSISITYQVLGHIEPSLYDSRNNCMIVRHSRITQSSNKQAYLQRLTLQIKITGVQKLFHGQFNSL